MIGVPIGNRKRVARMTPAGYAGNISKYFADRDASLATAKNAVSYSLHSRISKYGSNPYLNHLNTRVVTGMGATDWTDVASTFVSEIGAGIATRIGGGTKGATTIIQAPPKSEPFPTWAKVALVVGVGGVALMLVRRS